MKTTKPVFIWSACRVAFQMGGPTTKQVLSGHKKHDLCPVLTTLLKVLSGISLIPIGSRALGGLPKLMIDKE
ncbi:hypothetical protein [Silvimonas iriomotensis]|uniref:hypothetical protein n=1 Tax=Silvimonas iriomotensis TaxID=449662 RepID=UPI001663E9AD|nr:hypothetical protein [Silvimonas iriomotensis]